MARIRCRAFTYIELLVAVSVLAVLIAASYPTYQGQILKIRRLDARKSLVAVAHQMERCYTAYHRYNHPDCTSHLDCYTIFGQSLVPEGLTIAAPSCEGSYRITSIDPGSGETLTSESYSLFALPQGHQQRDNPCALFRYDSSDARTAKSAAGLDATADCW